MSSYIIPVILVAAGAVFLLVNMEVLPAPELRGVFGEWSPIVLIAVGLTLFLRPTQR